MTVGMPSFFVPMRSGPVLGCPSREYSHVVTTCSVAIQPVLHCSTSSLQNVSTCMSNWRCINPKFSDRQAVANGADPDQTATRGPV